MRVLLELAELLDLGPLVERVVDGGAACGRARRVDGAQGELLELQQHGRPVERAEGQAVGLAGDDVGQRELDLFAAGLDGEVDHRRDLAAVDLRDDVVHLDLRVLLAQRTFTLAEVGQHLADAFEALLGLIRMGPHIHLGRAGPDRCGDVVDAALDQLVGPVAGDEVHVGDHRDLESELLGVGQHVDDVRMHERLAAAGQLHRLRPAGCRVVEQLEQDLRRQELLLLLAAEAIGAHHQRVAPAADAGVVAVVGQIDLEHSWTAQRPLPLQHTDQREMLLDEGQAARRRAEQAPHDLFGIAHELAGQRKSLRERQAQGFGHELVLARQFCAPAVIDVSTGPAVWAARCPVDPGLDALAKAPLVLWSQRARAKAAQRGLHRSQLADCRVLGLRSVLGRADLVDQVQRKRIGQLTDLRREPLRIGRRGLSGEDLRCRRRRQQRQSDASERRQLCGLLRVQVDAAAQAPAQGRCCFPQPARQRHSVLGEERTGIEFQFGFDGQRAQDRLELPARDLLLRATGRALAAAADQTGQPQPGWPVDLAQLDRSRFAGCLGQRPLGIEPAAGVMQAVTGMLIEGLQAGLAVFQSRDQPACGLVQQVGPVLGQGPVVGCLFRPGAWRQLGRIEGALAGARSQVDQRHLRVTRG